MSSRHYNKRPHHIVVLMFDDVAVMHVSLRRDHACWQLEFRANRREISGIHLDGILEAARLRRGRKHRRSRERCWIDPARDAVRSGVRRLKCLGIEGRAADDLERYEMQVHRMCIAGEIDVYPVFDSALLWRFRSRTFDETDAV